MHTGADAINTYLRENGSCPAIAFFVDNGIQYSRGWMRALARKLRLRGYRVIGILAPQARDANLCGMDRIFHAKNEDLPKIAGVSCFLLYDIDVYHFFPGDSRVLCVKHASTGDPNPGNFLLGGAIAPLADGYIVGFPFAESAHEIRELYEDWIVTTRRPREHYYLMGYGHPKLATIHEQIALGDFEMAPGCLCYAPSHENWSPERGGNRNLNYAREAIQALLDGFPDRKLIFRPFPNEEALPGVQAILKEFSSNPRFIPDFDESYINTYRDSLIMVSDISNAAHSFMTLTGRRSCYWQPWNDSNMTFENQPSVFSDPAALIGFCTEAMEKASIAPSPGMLAAWGLLPFENELDRLADDLADFIADNPHPDWLRIKRNRAGRAASPLRVINAVRKYPFKPMQLHYALNYAIMFNYKLVAIFYLHLLHSHSPSLKVPQNMADLSGRPELAEREAAYLNLAMIAQMYEQGLEEIDPAVCNPPGSEEEAGFRQLCELAAKGLKC